MQSATGNIHQNSSQYPGRMKAISLQVRRRTHNRFFAGKALLVTLATNDIRAQSQPASSGQSKSPPFQHAKPEGAALAENRVKNSASSAKSVGR
jgi:hypothetical protein